MGGGGVSPSFADLFELYKSVLNRCFNTTLERSGLEGLLAFLNK